MKEKENVMFSVRIIETRSCIVHAENLCTYFECNDCLLWQPTESTHRTSYDQIVCDRYWPHVPCHLPEILLERGGG